MLLTAFDMSERIHYLNARQTLQRLLAWHVVPVINENDTTATDEITFGDNDFLSAQVAIMIEARRLILLTDQAGLFSADPRLDSGAELVEEVTDTAELDRYEIGSRGSQFGSGGMRSKVVAAQMASGSGIGVTICDGTAAGTLLAAARGERVGTSFTGRDDRAPSFKLWLRWATPRAGPDRRRRRRRARPPRARLLAAAGRHHRRRGQLRGRRPGRGRRRPRDRRQGDRRALLRGPPAPGRQAQQRGRRDPPRRRRGGDPPGSLRPHLSGAGRISPRPRRPLAQSAADAASSPSPGRRRSRRCRRSGRPGSARARSPARRRRRTRGRSPTIRPSP